MVVIIVSKKDNGLFSNSIMNNIMKTRTNSNNEIITKSEYMGLLPKEQIEKLQNKGTNNQNIGKINKFLSKNRSNLFSNQDSYEIRQNLITEANIKTNDKNQEE